MKAKQEYPKVNVVFSIESYEGMDTWLEVGGVKNGKMYAIMMIDKDGASTDFGYRTRREATAAATDSKGTLVIQGE